MVMLLLKIWLLTYHMELQTLTNVKKTYMIAKLKQIVTTPMGITIVSVQRSIPGMEQRKEGANSIIKMQI